MYTDVASGCIWMNNLCRLAKARLYSYIQLLHRNVSLWVTLVVMCCLQINGWKSGNRKWAGNEEYHNISTVWWHRTLEGIETVQRCSYNTTMFCSNEFCYLVQCEIILSLYFVVLFWQWTGMWGPVLKTDINGRRNRLRWPYDTLYPLKLALTSPSSGGRSVLIVYVRTKSHRV
jgi:hypothetical protein